MPKTATPMRDTRSAVGGEKHEMQSRPMSVCLRNSAGLASNGMTSAFHAITRFSYLRTEIGTGIYWTKQTHLSESAFFVCRVSSLLYKLVPQAA